MTRNTDVAPRHRTMAGTAGLPDLPHLPKTVRTRRLKSSRSWRVPPRAAPEVLASELLASSARARAGTLDVASGKESSMTTAASLTWESEFESRTATSPIASLSVVPIFPRAATAAARTSGERSCKTRRRAGIALLAVGPQSPRDFAAASRTCEEESSSAFIRASIRAAANPSSSACAYLDPSTITRTRSTTIERQAWCIGGAPSSRGDTMAVRIMKRSRPARPNASVVLFWFSVKWRAFRRASTFGQLLREASRIRACNGFRRQWHESREMVRSGHRFNTIVLLPGR